MPFTGNFTSVMLGADEGGAMTLKVNGTSQQPDDVEQIYVSVAHADAKKTLLSTDLKGVAGELPCGTVAAKGSTGWTVVLGQADPAYKLNETVLLVGVMVGADGEPPFSWHETMKITDG
jgi:hypothetical protein